jgi:alpha-galactosidase
LPERKGGWGGTPAVALSEAGRRLDTDLGLADWRCEGGSITLTFADEQLGITLLLDWRIDAHGVLACRASITNLSARALTLGALASLALPMPQRFTEMTSYQGRWAGEMREHRRTIAPGGFARASAIGKPGFTGGNWLLLHAACGETLAAHLAWSGDYETAIECDIVGAADGRARLQMGARLEPGEIALAPGESFEAPAALLARGASRDAVAQAFHAHLRDGVIAPGTSKAVRKVHLNSWEALGFDLSENSLFALVDRAAELGVERFVLDDGWFAGRRSDRTSLGDWFVSPDIFPQGLGPLIERIRQAGMDFGLWVEPEMVSPGSDLYRAHPDWCLHIEGRERGTMRGQLVLDLTKPEVTRYLAERLGALLSEYDIAYLKWDHNRDLFPLAGKGTAQTQALYALLDRFRGRVEIEACSSGGGRIDAGILARTDRVWPSDNNDAIERLRILPAWSQFLPLEVLGSHVGPSPNPITGRRLAMDFRAKVALFGHMGVEADPARMSDGERASLAAHIALYKKWRGVLHAGRLFRIEHADEGISGLMALHEGRGLALVAQTQFSPVFDAAPVRLPGLDPHALYRVTLPEPWPSRGAPFLADPESWREGLVLSGRALGEHGLALPLTRPETAWLIALETIKK